MQIIVKSLRPAGILCYISTVQHLGIMSKSRMESLLSGLVLLMIPRRPRCEAPLTAENEGCEAPRVLGAAAFWQRTEADRESVILRRQ